MKIYIVVFDINIKNEILVDRIKGCAPDTFKALENVWFIASDHTTNEDIYNKINIDDKFGKSSIMVAEIKTKDGDYWGCMNRNLWPWLANKSVE